MGTLGIDTAGMMMWDTATARLSHAAHELAKTEISIEPPVEMMTASSESEMAAHLVQAASDLQQYSLNILG